jgi:hypothetical protein
MRGNVCYLWVPPALILQDARNQSGKHARADLPGSMQIARTTGEHLDKVWTEMRESNPPPNNNNWKIL